MTIGWNLLWFIVCVSLLVTVHEFGHYWVARRLGFKVLRFSIGFGKPLLRWVGKGPDHVEYVIAALPLGGYVKMLDEREGHVAAVDAPRAFGAKAPWKRILVLLAGPAANILFAILVLWAIYWTSEIVRVKPIAADIVVGSPAAAAGLRDGDVLLTIADQPVGDQGDAAIALLDAVSGDGDVTLGVRGRDGRDRNLTLSLDDSAQRRRLTEPNQLMTGLGFDFWMPEVPAELGGIVAGGPAEKADLRAGDVVVALDGTTIRTFKEFYDYVRARPGKNLLVTIERNGQSLTKRVTTAVVEEKDKQFGRLGVEGPKDLSKYVPADRLVRTEYGPLAALGAASGRAWQLTAMQTKFFARMLTGKISLKNLSSPIGIASYAGDSARQGAGQYISFLVLISLSLGFLNLLPIPILDGGQIVFVVAEWLKGGPLSERAQMVGWHAGLVMLALLMGVAVFNDLSSRFGSS
jgi:regulator of sigma E protease